jgi:hypothetical protein
LVDHIRENRFGDGGATAINGLVTVEGHCLALIDGVLRFMSVVFG